MTGPGWQRAIFPACFPLHTSHFHLTSKIMQINTPAQRPASIHAIVTGHSRGLGAALVYRLAERGVKVMGLARGGLDQPPPNLSETSLDLADASALADWLDTGALATFLRNARTVLLLNNAGTALPVGALGTGFMAGSAVNVLRAVQLNCGAPLALAEATVACARQCGAETRILHLSSGAARMDIPEWSVYCATKAALDRHAGAVAQEGRPDVKICSMAPGVVDTAMQLALRTQPAHAFGLSKEFQALQSSGALRAPADCARALIDYLLAPEFGALARAEL